MPLNENNRHISQSVITIKDITSFSHKFEIIINEFLKIKFKLTDINMPGKLTNFNAISKFTKKIFFKQNFTEFFSTKFCTDVQQGGIVVASLKVLEHRLPFIRQVKRLQVSDQVIIGLVQIFDVFGQLKKVIFVLLHPKNSYFLISYIYLNKFHDFLRYKKRVNRRKNSKLSLIYVFLTNQIILMKDNKYKLFTCSVEICEEISDLFKTAFD
ncbi:hypothetical protein BpHYR1_021474 [Brachionus plicatilis]|uniref:Uncharacterized protein n=1 Tax=Brachionus plicatilis TaxID=10195 RepID=A0A3M7R7X4_BRAPC|nr:hypothetical protein BpHYR1_021474 [Brachionus plicatilis]